MKIASVNTIQYNTNSFNSYTNSKKINQRDLINVSFAGIEPYEIEKAILNNVKITHSKDQVIEGAIRLIKDLYIKAYRYCGVNGMGDQGKRYLECEEELLEFLMTEYRIDLEPGALKKFGIDLTN